MATPEGRVKLATKRRLKKVGWWFFSPVSNGMGAHGIPDIICCIPTLVTPDMVGKTIGVFGGIETKAAGKRHNVSELQRERLNEIEAAGGRVWVIDDVSQLEV